MMRIVTVSTLKEVIKEKNVMLEHVDMHCSSLDMKVLIFVFSDQVQTL
jgi:hypothetical protein